MRVRLGNIRQMVLRKRWKVGGKSLGPHLNTSLVFHGVNSIASVRPCETSKAFLFFEGCKILQGNLGHWTNWMIQLEASEDGINGVVTANGCQRWFLYIILRATCLQRMATFTSPACNGPLWAPSPPRILEIAAHSWNLKIFGLLHWKNRHGNNQRTHVSKSRKLYLLFYSTLAGFNRCCFMFNLVEHDPSWPVFFPRRPGSSTS